MLPSATPCLASNVEFGTDIASSAANYHFHGEAAAVASSTAGGKNKLWIWDIERSAVHSYLSAFDDDGSASSWAECIWGHHPRSIFCLGLRCMKMVDLRSAAVSTAIHIGTAGFLPSGRFHGAHSPCDPRVPMIVTTSSSAVSLWDLRFLREPVAQHLHHLEHDPPSLVSSSIRSNRGDGAHNSRNGGSLVMDVLVCSSMFGHPLLHSITIGDEATPLTTGLPQSIPGLRHAHQLHHSSRALHPDGAQSSATCTSGMCLLSSSVPKGIETVAFFASLSGNIWLSYTSDESYIHIAERAPAAHAKSAQLQPSISGRAVAPCPALDDVLDKNSTSRFPDESNERSPLLLSEFQKWMAFPRMPPSPSPPPLSVVFWPFFVNFML